MQKPVVWWLIRAIAIFSAEKNSKNKHLFLRGAKTNITAQKQTFTTQKQILVRKNKHNLFLRGNICFSGFYFGADTCMYG